MSRPRVRMTEHAEIRAEQRLPMSHGLRHEIEGRLNTALKLGAKPTGPDCEITVMLGDGARAICYPQWSGGWAVATITPPAQREEGMA